MDVFLLPFLILSVFGVKIAHKGNLFNENNLDRDHTDALRGFLCILIVLDHCSLLTGSGYSVILLKRVGPYIVAMFYALSAYGLLASYKKNGFSLKGYWKKRLLSTIVPYLIFYSAAIVLQFVFKENLSVKAILLSFVNGHPLVRYSWFIITIIVFYAIFYAAALLARKDIPLLTAIVGFALFFFVFAVNKLDFEDFWFNAAWAFPFGLLWQHVQPKIARAFRRHPWSYLVITGLVALWWIAIAEYFFWFGYLSRLCSTLAMCIFILLLMFKLKIGNPVLGFLGKKSLFIYMSHGLLVTVFSNFISPVEHPYLFVALLVAGSILFAWLFHLLYSGLQKLFKKKPVQAR